MLTNYKGVARTLEKILELWVSTQGRHNLGEEDTSSSLELRSHWRYPLSCPDQCWSIVCRKTVNILRDEGRSRLADVHTDKVRALEPAHPTSSRTRAVCRYTGISRGKPQEGAALDCMLWVLDETGCHFKFPHTHQHSCNKEAKQIYSWDQ